MKDKIMVLMDSQRLAALISSFLLLGMISGCATLYRTQYGDIDHSLGELKPFEVILSEIGVSHQQAAEIGAAVAAASGSKKTSGAFGGLKFLLAISNYGPTTGNPVFSDKYSDVLWDILRGKCPNGRITGLMVVREAAKYPVISGEIVRVSGYCAATKDKESTQGVIQ